MQSTGTAAKEPVRATGSGGLWRDAAAAAAFAIGLFLLVATTPDVPSGFDAYRHVKFASRMIQDPAEAMRDPWRLATLWPKPVDPYVGFHLLLAPLTKVFDLITAAKLFGALIVGGIALTLLRLLRHLNAAHGAAWVVIALTGSGIALHRYTTSRPYVLALLLVLVVALLAVKNKPIAVGIVSALHAISYSMFFFVAMAPGIWLLLRRDRRALAVALSCAIGTAVGLLANPYFPENVLYVLAATRSLGIATKAGVAVGEELWPMSPGWFSVASLPVTVLWLAAAVVRLRQWRERSLGSGGDLFLIASVIALAGSLRVGRTFDFFVPFAIIFAARELTPWLMRKRRQAACAAVALLGLCAMNVVLTIRAGLGTIPVERYRGVSEYLLRHAPGELVINAQWGDYYYLYFWNTSNRYFIGIEPTLAYMMDAEKYWLWRHLQKDESTTCGRRECSQAERTDAVTAVTRDLGARYLLTRRSANRKLESVLDRHSEAAAVFRDADLTLYRLGR